ncbi:hypothetical protein FBU59_000978, partial [Linderina macrospora]
MSNGPMPKPPRHAIASQSHDLVGPNRHMDMMSDMHHFSESSAAPAPQQQQQQQSMPGIGGIGYSGHMPQLPETSEAPYVAIDHTQQSPDAPAVISTRTPAAQTNTADSSNTVDTFNSASRMSDEPCRPTHAMPAQETPRGNLVARGASRTTVSSSVSSGSSLVMEEKYIKEFNFALQALLQAMELNLPLSSVMNLYKLQLVPTHISTIGSSSAAAKRQAKKDDISLAGALCDGVEAARSLQHVVSSEVLSLVKDEVSESPAFSVIIDEAPIREHNSLVAHVLLYLRYLRRDPLSETGELEVTTRFWRCVHLYHGKDGRVARRDPIGIVMVLLERAKIDLDRLVCISYERPTTKSLGAIERRRLPHALHWHGVFTYEYSLSPQLYEDIANKSDDFISFSMTLMDLCLFVYSHPGSFAFLGIEFQETLYKTLFGILLTDTTRNTRLPISLMPAIVTAIARNISQIVVTVAALAKVSSARQAPSNLGQSRSSVIPDTGDGISPSLVRSPKSPRAAMQIPLPVVDILMSSVGSSSVRSASRCPLPDMLYEHLRDYNFLGCLHFMADILLQVKPILDLSEREGQFSCPFAMQGDSGDNPKKTLDQLQRTCVDTIRDVVDSINQMYGDDRHDEEDEDNGGNSSMNVDRTPHHTNPESGEEDYAGHHLNEFMQLTTRDDDSDECTFRSFKLCNYSKEESPARLIELIRTAASAILQDLHTRFAADDLDVLQAISGLWNPARYPAKADDLAVFGNVHLAQFAEALRRRDSTTSISGLGVCGSSGSELGSQPSTQLVDMRVLVEEWRLFKAEAYRELSQRRMAAIGAASAEKAKTAQA